MASVRSLWRGRFARDLAVQLAGHDHLRKLGVTLIPATAPDFFTEDTPTAVLVRQVLGAIAQFDKATIVAKLKAARDRKIAVGEKCGGRKSYAEARPEMVELARQLRRPNPDRRPVSLRKIAAALAERGYVASTGKPYKRRPWHQCSASRGMSPEPEICGRPRGRNRYRRDCRWQWA
jgi:DNA invertase Pin-like site-specific DNA recombinase